MHHQPNVCLTKASYVATGEIVPATIESDEDDVDDEDEYDSGGGDAVADSEDEQ